MRRQELVAYAIAAAICVGTLAISAAIILHDDTTEIDTTDMTPEQIHNLDLWMGVE